MKVTIGYGKDETFELEIDNKQLIGVYNPNSVEKIDYNKAIDEALASPLGKESFDAFIDTDERIVFIVNDGTRPTPTRKVLARIYPKIKDKDIYFIVATGCHRAPTDIVTGKQIGRASCRERV